MLGDRGYSSARGIAHVAAAGGRVAVRVNTGSLAFAGADGRPFDLLGAVSSLDRAGAARAWPVATAGDAPVRGRVCAVRKSDTAIRLAQKKLRGKASKLGKELRPETLEFAKYVVVFTTFPAADFTPAAVLDCYRVRWQVELVFKRFKSITRLGHLPKHDDQSAQAWLYGKLFTALLVEKLVRPPAPFPPGDTARRKNRTPSRWREFRFAANQAARAIEPHLALGDMIGAWGEISRALSEPPRKRTPQIERYFGVPK